jgi:hypothetical protein
VGGNTHHSSNTKRIEPAIALTAAISSTRAHHASLTTSSSSISAVLVAASAAAVRQHIDTAVGDRVDQQRRIPAATTQREVIDAQHRRDGLIGQRHAEQHAQHSAAQDSDTQTLQHRRTGSARHDDREKTDQRAQLPGPPRPPARQLRHLLPERSPRTLRPHAPQPPDLHIDHDATTRYRQSSDPPTVIGVHPPCRLIT